MEFSKRKVIDGLEGADETQLGQQTEQMVRKRRQEALRSLVRSLEVKGKERVVLDPEKDRLGAARIKQVPSDSSGAFHISGIQSTSSFQAFSQAWWVCTPDSGRSEATLVLSHPFREMISVPSEMNGLRVS